MAPADIPDRYHDWVADALDKDPRSYSSSSGSPGSGIDPSKLVVVDLKQLHTDLDGARSSVEQALQAVTKMDATAASAQVNLDDPGGAATALAETTTPVSDADRKRLGDLLAAVTDQRQTLEGLYHQMQGQLDIQRKATTELHALPNKMSDEFWKDLDKQTDGVGVEAEHVWDFVNQFTGAIVASLTDPMTMVHAIAASDLVKDKVKELSEQIDVHNEKLETLGATLNQVITAVGEAVKQEIKNANLQLQRIGTDYGKAATSYRDHLAEYENSLVAVVAGAPGDNSKRKPIIQAYLAVLNAGELCDATRSGLVTQTLAPGKYDAWLAQLDPPGSQILDAPDTQKPGSISGNWVVFDKNGKQWAYGETTQSLAVLVDGLRKVKGFYDADKRVTPLAEAWKKAVGTGTSGGAQSPSSTA